MRNISFHIREIKAAIMPRAKIARSLGPRCRKFNYWSALILALLVAPFAAQAMPDNGTFEADSEAYAEQSSPSTSQAEPEVKADAGEVGSSTVGSVEVETKRSTGSDSSEVDVTINSKKVSMPENGSLHKEINSNNGRTVVDVRIDSESSSGSEVSSSATVEVNSHTLGNNQAQRRRLVRH